MVTAVRGHHLYVNWHRNQLPHSRRSVEIRRPVCVAIVDSHAKVCYNPDNWIDIQTLIAVNLSVVQAAIELQCDEGTIACTQGLDRRGLVGAFVYYSPWVMRVVMPEDFMKAHEDR